VTNNSSQIIDEKVIGPNATGKSDANNQRRSVQKQQIIRIGRPDGKKD
jgi:hypothetical protein